MTLLPSVREQLQDAALSRSRRTPAHALHVRLASLGTRPAGASRAALVALAAVLLCAAICLGGALGGNSGGASAIRVGRQPIARVRALVPAPDPGAGRAVQAAYLRPVQSPLASAVLAVGSFSVRVP